MILPFVSVIIPVFNDTARLRQCLAALAQQTYPADRVEVIVIDNGSTEPITASIGDLPHLVIEHEPRPGGSRARVTGMARARGELLAFTDADCLPAPDWLQRGVARFTETPSCGAVGGRIEMFADGESSPSVATSLSLATHLRQDRFVAGGWAVCANLFTARAVIDAVGAMNPALLSSGETEWCHRVRQAGYAIVFAPDAVVRHPARSSIPSLIRRAIRLEFAWRQLQQHAPIGRGVGFWVRQHLVWPLRDVVRDVLGNARLSLGRRARMAALALLLMVIRIVAWVGLRLGITYDVRSRWG